MATTSVGIDVGGLDAVDINTGNVTINTNADGIDFIAETDSFGPMFRVWASEEVVSIEKGGLSWSVGEPAQAALNISDHTWLLGATIYELDLTDTSYNTTALPAVPALVSHRQMSQETPLNVVLRCEVLAAETSRSLKTHSSCSCATFVVPVLRFASTAFDGVIDGFSSPAPSLVHELNAVVNKAFVFVVPKSI